MPRMKSKTEGPERREPSAVAKGLRRAKRWLKAGAAVGLAITAGGFIALTSLLSGGCDDATTPADSGKSVDSARADMSGDDLKHKDLSGDLKQQKDTAVVDLKQHKDGMPVPDNLLE